LPLKPHVEWGIDLPYELNPFYKYAVMFVTHKGISFGSPAGSGDYKPLDPVNRGSMAQFLRRTLGVPDFDKTKKIPDFIDLGTGIDGRDDDIRWLASEGITKGSPENSNTYKPWDTVNRGSMATFLYRLAGSPKYTAPSVSPFTDVDSSNIHYTAICWLAKWHITQGSPAGSDTYRPYDVVNRGAMANFLARITDYYILNVKAGAKCKNPPTEGVGLYMQSFDMQPEAICAWGIIEPR
jgi:hypothetical protein